MSIIYVLIPIAVLLTAIGIYLFLWAVKTEQFDDLEKQGLSILFDDTNEKNARSDHESQDCDEHSNTGDSETVDKSGQTDQSSAQTLDNQPVKK